MTVNDRIAPKHGRLSDKQAQRQKRVEERERNAAQKYADMSDKELLLLAGKTDKLLTVFAILLFFIGIVLLIYSIPALNLYGILFAGLSETAVLVLNFMPEPLCITENNRRRKQRGKHAR